MDEDNKKIIKTNNKKLLILGLALIIVAVFAITIPMLMNRKTDSDNKKETVDEQILRNYPYLYVVTAKYGATPESKEFIDNIFGENAEEKFRTYFQWFNVVHELAHGIIIYNSNIDYLKHLSDYSSIGYIEEQKVNDFAAAYWKKYGDPEKVQLLKDTVDYILSNMTDPSNGTLTIEEYGKMLWQNSNPDSSFEAYGWYQFNLVKAALEKDLSLEEAMSNLGIDKVLKYDDEMLSYETINEETCDKIIEDTVNKFKKWGLAYPEIYHSYDDDPNNNYSNPISYIQYKQLKGD